MTLVIALKWYFSPSEEAVVISADSRATMGPVSYEVRKIYPIVLREDDEEIPLAVAGGAGDASIVKQSFRIAERTLIEMAKEEWGNRTPSFEEFEEAIRAVETRLIRRFSQLRGQGIEIDFQMILASVDPHGKASIYLFDPRGLAEPMHDDPGFAVIGKGFFTGGNLLLRLIGYSPAESIGMDLGLLSAFIIDAVSEIDTSVGPFVGESWLMRVDRAEGKVMLGPLKDEALREFKDKVRKRKELIRKLWRLCEVVEKEEEVDKIIEEALEKRRKQGD